MSRHDDVMRIRRNVPITVDTDPPAFPWPDDDPKPQPPEPDWVDAALICFAAVASLMIIGLILLIIVNVIGALL